VSQMTRFFSLRISVAGIVLAMGMCGLISCQPSASTTGRNQRRKLSSTRRIVPCAISAATRRRRTHLRKHVGQTDEQLRERLEQERHITGASNLHGPRSRRACSGSSDRTIAGANPALALQLGFTSQPGSGLRQRAADWPHHESWREPVAPLHTTRWSFLNTT